MTYKRTRNREIYVRMYTFFIIDAIFAFEQKFSSCFIITYLFGMICYVIDKLVYIYFAKYTLYKLNIQITYSIFTALLASFSETGARLVVRSFLKS